MVSNHINILFQKRWTKKTRVERIRRKNKKGRYRLYCWYL